MKPSRDELTKLIDTPTREIAGSFGVSTSTVRQWFSDEGIKRDRLGRVDLSPMPRYDKPPVISPDCLILSDTHVPFHDAKFVNNCIELAEAWNIKNLCLPGDTFDMTAVSKFHTRPETNLKIELNEGQKFFIAMSQAFDDILFLPGNHERRLLHLLEEQIEMEHFLSLMRAGSKVRTSSYSYGFVGRRNSDWLVGHPRNASIVAGRVPVSLIRKYPQIKGVATGHGHLVGLVISEDGERMCVDIGIAADPKRFDWVSENISIRPSMAQGALILKKLDSGAIWPYALYPKMDWAAMMRMYS